MYLKNDELKAILKSLELGYKEAIENDSADLEKISRTLSYIRKKALYAYEEEATYKSIMPTVAKNLAEIEMSIEFLRSSLLAENKDEVMLYSRDIEVFAKTLNDIVKKFFKKLA